MIVIFNVPMINAQIPYDGLAENGFQSVENKNSVIGTRVKNVIVYVSKVNKIPNVTKIEIAAMIAKIIGTILSLVPPFLALFLAIISLIFVFEAI